MSSLRLALKKSMEEAKRGGKGTSSRKHASVTKKRDDNGEGREWDETPRKRGRPRKHPLPKDLEDDEENFSSENEFSVGHADEEEIGDEESETSDHEDRRDSSHEAANRIQKQWKKQQRMKLKEKDDPPGETSKRQAFAREDGEYKVSDQHHRNTSSPIPPSKNNSRPTSPEATERKTSVSSGAEDSKSKVPKTSKPRTVPPPSQHLSSWQTNHIAPKRARKNVIPGLRVKVRFALRKEGGKKKKKWFGGLITAVSKEGTKVKIMYDDGTHEITKFPDKDIVIDDTENGEHKAPLGIIEKFLPPEQTEMGLPQSTEAGNKVEFSEVTEIENATLPINENGNISDNKSKLIHPPKSVQSAGFSKHDQTDLQPNNVKLKESTETPQFITNTTLDAGKQHTEAASPRKAVSEADIAAEQTSVRAKVIPTSEAFSYPIQHFAETGLNHNADDTVLSKEMSVEEPERSISAESPIEPPKKRKRGRPPKLRPPTDADAAISNQDSEITAIHFTKPSLSAGNVQQARSSLTIRIPLGKSEHQQPPGRSPKPSKGANTLESSGTRHGDCVPSPKGIKRKQYDPSSSVLSDDPSNRAFADISEDGVSSPQSSPRHKKKKIRKVLESTEKDTLSGAADESSVAAMPSLGNENFISIVGSGNSALQKSLKSQDGALDMTESRLTPEQSTLYEESDLTPARSRSKQQASQEGALIVRSGRRAAQQANERIVAKVDSSEQLMKLKKKKRRDDEVDEHSSKHPLSEWVQCDRCGKWRVIPSNLVGSLPKQWYCEDNIHDPKRASCDAPEQTPKEVAKERKRAKKKKQRILEATAAAEGEKLERVRSPHPDDDADEAIQLKRSSPGTLVENSEDQVKSDRKGGISTGRKGRPGPAGASSDTLDAVIETIPEVRRGRGRPRRNTVQGNKEIGHPPSNKENSDDADNVEWVQCEKCDKWRKLPPHISADELPDVWYCDMNTWSSTLTCDDPEDKADGLLDVGFLGSSGGAGKLSYRNLIFGSTGRKANRPISERTRAAESLFGTIAEGEDVPPIVKYSNCSAFISRSKAVSGPEENKGPSFFDIMQNSRFISELRSVQEANSLRRDFGNSDGELSLIFGQTFDSLPQDMKEPVKELVLDALGSSTLSGDEIAKQVKSSSRENISDVYVRALSYCSLNVVITALCALAKDGVLEVVRPNGATWTISNWNPRYRRVLPLLTKMSEITHTSELKRKETRFMKISKPWKHAQMQ